MSESCKGSFYISKASPSIYRLKGYILQNPGLGLVSSRASSDSRSLCIAIFALNLHIVPVSVPPPTAVFLLSPLHLFLCLLSRRSQEREVQARRQMLEEERRRREEAERRLLDETAHRQRLVEEEVKMREKHFSQVSGAAGGDGRRRRG